MLIKNEKIGQNFRENTKIRQKSNKKSGRPAWKNEKFEKIFLREKKFSVKISVRRIFPVPNRTGYVIGPRLGLACKADGTPDLSGNKLGRLTGQLGQIKKNGQDRASNNAQSCP